MGMACLTPKHCLTSSYLLLPVWCYLDSTATFILAAVVNVTLVYQIMHRSDAAVQATIRCDDSSTLRTNLTEVMAWSMNRHLTLFSAVLFITDE